jgi:hypothetical protein
MSGFFDTYEDATQAAFIGEDEKNELIAAVTPLPVVGVSEGTTKFGPRFFLKVLLDGEERTLAFAKANEDGGVPSRDDLLTQLAAFLETPGAEHPTVCLEKRGRAILIRSYPLDEA